MKGETNAGIEIMARRGADDSCRPLGTISTTSWILVVKIQTRMNPGCFIAHSKFSISRSELYRSQLCLLAIGKFQIGVRSYIRPSRLLPETTKGLPSNLHLLSCDFVQGEP